MVWLDFMMSNVDVANRVAALESIPHLPGKPDIEPTSPNGRV
jgi:hypothetical protein